MILVVNKQRRSLQQVHPKMAMKVTSVILFATQLVKGKLETPRFAKHIIGNSSEINAHEVCL
jgi:hypothetical protein